MVGEEGLSIIITRGLSGDKGFFKFTGGGDIGISIIGLGVFLSGTE
jgi:hypothetical protein